MKIRNVSILGVTAAALMFTSAQAAETVIGGGAALSCYQAAEYGVVNSREAIAFCNDALTGILLDRDRAATLVNRGILKLVSMDAQGSYDDFNRGLSLRADMAEGYVDRGASLILMKRYQEAIDQINKGLAMNAKRPQVAYFDRAMAHEGLGNLSAAYADYKQAQLIDPFFVQPAEELKRFKVVSKPAGT